MEVRRHCAECMYENPVPKRRYGQGVQDIAIHLRIRSQETMTSLSPSRDEVGFTGMNCSCLAHAWLNNQKRCQSCLCHFPRAFWRRGGGDRHGGAWRPPDSDITMNERLHVRKLAWSVGVWLIQRRLVNVGFAIVRGVRCSVHQPRFGRSSKATECASTGRESAPPSGVLTYRLVCW
jgi:hypothetical protein